VQVRLYRLFFIPLCCRLPHNAFPPSPSQVLYAFDPSTLPSLVPHTQAIHHECYTLVISIFLFGLYLGLELRSANSLPDFSAASCTKPLPVLSTWPSHTQAIPHECYTLVIFLLGLYLGLELRSANSLPDFSAASCTKPLLVLSTWPHHSQAIPSRVLYARDSVLLAWILPWI
jgi:hypothetical protein